MVHCFRLREVAGRGGEGWRVEKEQYRVEGGDGEKEWRRGFLASVVASFLFDFMVVSISRW